MSIPATLTVHFDDPDRIGFEIYAGDIPVCCEISQGQAERIAARILERTRHVEHEECGADIVPLTKIAVVN